MSGLLILTRHQPQAPQNGRHPEIPTNWCRGTDRHIEQKSLSSTRLVPEDRHPPCVPSLRRDFLDRRDTPLGKFQ